MHVSALDKTTVNANDQWLSLLKKFRIYLKNLALDRLVVTESENFDVKKETQ
jgi:hypothetical protein